MGWLNRSTAFAMYMIHLMLVVGCVSAPGTQGRGEPMAETEAEAWSESILIPCVDVSDPPVVVVYRMHGGFVAVENSPCVVLCAVWNDGRIVWAVNPRLERAGYHTAQLDPRQVDEFFENLRGMGVDEEILVLCHD